MAFHPLEFDLVLGVDLQETLPEIYVLLALETLLLVNLAHFLALGREERSRERDRLIDGLVRFSLGGLRALLEARAAPEACSIICRFILAVSFRGAFRCCMRASRG